MIQKQLLVPDRVRRPPREGWSWIDRRFLKQHALRLRMGEQAVVRARDELVAEDLVAHRAPLTQVLSLPDRGRTSRGGLASLGEIFQALGQSNSQMRRQP